MSSRRIQGNYDHRLVQLVRQTGDPSIATRLGIPRTTVAGRIRRAQGPVKTTGTAEESMAGLRGRVARLEKRVELLRSVLRIRFAPTQIVKPDLSRLRVPAPVKARLLRAIRRTREVRRSPERRPPPPAVGPLRPTPGAVRRSAAKR